MKRTIKIVGADHTPIETTLSSWEVKEGRKSKATNVINEYKENVEDREKKAENIIQYYKAIAQDIENELGDDTKKLEVIGHQAEARKSDASKYSLYLDYQGGQYGNLVGSVRKKYSGEKFKKICKGFYSSINNSDEITVTIEIVSRFDLEKSDGLSTQPNLGEGEKRYIPQKPGKPYFLLTMLTCGQLRFNDLQISENIYDKLFDCLLIWKLKNHLLYAYQKGVYQTYHTFEENGDRFKGNIDFSRHIRLNMGMDNGRIAYRYREKTVDNYLNHLILAAYERLSDDYPKLVADNLDNDNDVSQVINLLMMETDFPKYTTGELINRCSMPITHPFYSEYEDLRRTCLSVLRNEGVSIMGGESDSDVSGVLYYVPDLWEEYLESVIRASNMDVDCQKSTGIVSNETISNPDFLLKYKDEGEEESHYYMILDAKFRRKWYDVYSSRFKLKKYGEDYNKCIRDMEALSMHAAGVIFPYNDSDDNLIDDKLAGQGNEGEENSVEENNSNKQEKTNYSLPRRYSVCADGNKKDLFYTIPIKIPNAEDESNSNYTEWKKTFDGFVKSQMKNLKTIADYERKFFENEKKLECMLDELSKLSTPGELDPSKLTEFKAILGKREARQKDVEAAANKPIDVKCIEINENSSEESENESL